MGALLSQQVHSSWRLDWKERVCGAAPRRPVSPGICTHCRGDGRVLGLILGSGLSVSPQHLKMVGVEFCPQNLRLEAAGLGLGLETCTAPW